MKKIILIILSISFFITFNRNIILANSIEENFIQALYEINYDEAVDFDSSLDQEMKNKIDTLENSESGCPIKFFSFDSDYIQNNIITSFHDIVDETYLEKLLINGWITEKYTTALTNKSDLKIDQLTLVSEETNRGTIKQKWQFILVETSIVDAQQIDLWEIDVVTYRSLESQKITYFKELRKQAQD
ncbi:hypothetical protein ACTQ45_05625 [Fundicoccus sp. Sow4_D5]|uniref:hypothetical protein n=1 Tax=Fundicoccus sp. Sow4_D5 TaxID=3438782 RepID=UPI003F93C8FD